MNKYQDRHVQRRYEKSFSLAVRFSKLKNNKKAEAARVLELCLPAAPSAEPGALPPRRHDPTDPECVCDRCDPEEG